MNLGLYKKIIGALKITLCYSDLSMMPSKKRKREGKKGGEKARRSRYVGVSWNKAAQKWMAQIQVAGVTQHLGCFDDEADGARVYDAAVAAQNLPYPRNFPDDSGAKQAKKCRISAAP